MELGISLALAVLKGAAGLGFRMGRRWAAEKFKDGNVILWNLIFDELDEVKSLLEKQGQSVLLASLKHFKTGIEYLNDVIDSTAQAEGKVRCLQASTFFEDPDPLTEKVKHWKLSDLDASARDNLEEAKKRFKDARKKATEAFSNTSLKTLDRVLAVNIGIMAVTLENIEKPSIALPECRHWLKDLHEMEEVKRAFQRALSRKSKKSPFSGEDQTKCFQGVCHINWLIYDITQTMTKKVEKSWIWPCIDVGEERVDPLRDARVAETFSKLNMNHYCITWSFGQKHQQQQKLNSARDIAINKQGHFIIADQGDRNIKIFDENGVFLRSFYPLCRRLADEDVLGVTTDSEDNLFILNRIDKYRYQVYVFDKLGNLKNRFRLREGFVRCSPIVNYQNEVLVVREGAVSKTAVVEVYKDWQNVDSFEPKEAIELADHKEPEEPAKSNVTTDPKEPKEPKQAKEPKDIALTDDGNIIVLNSDGTVDEFNKQEQERRQLFEGVPTEGLEAIAFHSLSKHLIITNISDGITKLSIYTKDGECVDIIHQGEVSSGKKEKNCIAPKIAVTTEGRIALLTGFEGESKVLVL